MFNFRRVILHLVQVFTPIAFYNDPPVYQNVGIATIRNIFWLSFLSHSSSVTSQSNTSQPSSGGTLSTTPSSFHLTPSVGILYFLHWDGASGGAWGAIALPPFLLAPCWHQNFHGPFLFLVFLGNTIGIVCKDFQTLLTISTLTTLAPPAIFSWCHHCSFRVFGIFLVGYFIIIPHFLKI